MHAAQEEIDAEIGDQDAEESQQAEGMEEARPPERLQLNISIHTVITHRRNISRKTGIKTVSGLTVYALLNHLLDIHSIE